MDGYKMKLYIFLIALILMGCEPQIIYQNVTIIREIEIPCPTCPVCPACVCETCEEPDYSSYIRELDKSQLDLRNCNIQRDLLNAEYTECRLQNTTEYTGSIEQNYTKCVRERRVCENQIGNITEII